MSTLHDAYTALLSGLTYKKNGKIKWIKNSHDIWITIIDVDKEEYYLEYDNGDKHWFQKEQRHRLDGPAVEYPNGDTLWYRKGKLHRLGGPAVNAYGHKEHWVDGIVWNYNDNS